MKRQAAGLSGGLASRGPGVRAASEHNDRTPCQGERLVTAAYANAPTHSLVRALSISGLQRAQAHSVSEAVLRIAGTQTLAEVPQAPASHGWGKQWKQRNQRWSRRESEGVSADKAIGRHPSHQYFARLCMYVSKQVTFNSFRYSSIGYFEYFSARALQHRFIAGY